MAQRTRAIAGAMAAGGIDLPGQVAQTAFRMKLVSGWEIQSGTSVLEIGCGQGDMTAALAEAVGQHGRVVAVDVADPSYGTPVTIGESAKVLRSSALGERIDIRLGFDVLDEANQFPDNAFDYIVLAHSAWYFASLEQLRRTLLVIRSWAPTLCFAEWDLRPDSASQLPHVLAVLLQGQLNANMVTGMGNVRTPFSSEAMERLLELTGWRVRQRHVVATTGLQDADWEISACLGLPDSVLSELPERSRDLVASQLDLLRAVAQESSNEPLPTYQIIADRTTDRNRCDIG